MNYFSLKSLLTYGLFVALLPMSASANNQALLQEIIQKAKTTDSSSLVIVQDGHVIYSNFFGKEDAIQDVESATKSICALAIATLIEEHKISSFDTPMSQWIPMWSSDPEKSKITLRMILNHTSGLPDNIHHSFDPSPDVNIVPDFFYHDDLVKQASTTPLIAKPGTQFLYSSIGSSLLQAVISQASNQTVSSYVVEKIFKPLGIADSIWAKDKVGQEVTSGGLSLSTGDLIKIGTMMMNHGRYNGRQIVSSASVKELIAKSQKYFEYGLLWWIYKGGKAFSAKGYGGQYLTVYPDKNLVAVRTKKIFRVDPKKVENEKFKDFPDLISKWQ